MIRQFKCYKCNEITNYNQEDYDELLKSKIVVIAWREMIYYIKCNDCEKLNRVELQTFSTNKNIPKEELLNGKPLTIEEDFYLSLAGEFVKNNSKFVNEVLRQFVTINTALLAGTITFMNKEIINENFKIFVIFSFLISLVISFIGILPYSGNINFISPYIIKEFNKKLLNHKLKYLKLSAVVSGIGFLIIVVGMIYKIIKH